MITRRCLIVFSAAIASTLPAVTSRAENGSPSSSNSSSKSTSTPTSVSYSWKSVQIVGGGFVDGFVFHPTAKDVCYARTDIGGAYRRDPRTHRWQPMLDWVSYADLNLMGVESIAVDPSDPSKVYLAAG